MHVAAPEPRAGGVTERAEVQGWALPSGRTAASSLPLMAQASLAVTRLVAAHPSPASAPGAYVGFLPPRRPG